MMKTLATGRIVAAVKDTVYVPSPRISRNPVVYLHGATPGNGSQAAGGTSITSVPNILWPLTKRGFAPVSTSMSYGFGNGTNRTETGTQVTYARNSAGASSGKVVLVGASMGSIVAFNYAAANPTLVACVIAVLAVCDLQHLRDVDFLGQKDDIEIAWSIGTSDPLPAGASPKDNTSALSAVPCQIWTSSDDDASYGIAAFASTIGADTHNLGALGHTDAAIAAVDATQVESFVEAHVT